MISSRLNFHLKGIIPQTMISCKWFLQAQALATGFGRPFFEPQLPRLSLPVQPLHSVIK
jgi:hypothetical protein